MVQIEDFSRFSSPAFASPESRESFSDQCKKDGMRYIVNKSCNREHSYPLGTILGFVGENEEVPDGYEFFPNPPLNSLEKN